MPIMHSKETLWK